MSEVPDVVIFFNHGCTPNIAPHGQVVFVAARDITADEEILCDYCTIVCYRSTDWSAGAAAQCRGVVTGDDWRRPDLRVRYRGSSGRSSRRSAPRWVPASQEAGDD
jgi:hypothetical protein